MNHLRLYLAVIGLAAALLAVTTGDRRIGWAAIAILLIYLIVRLVQRKRGSANRGDEPES
ncbi:MAG: hypothetical protein ACREL3_02865 [Gemmatimonadales bacterium]